MKKSMIKQCILSLLCLLWAGQTVLAGELRERVYLQTDKQFYLSGELVWMKFIATDLDQRLSDVSKVGYVELLDSASAVVQARLVLEKGVGNGCLQLPSTLRPETIGWWPIPVICGTRGRRSSLRSR